MTAEHQFISARTVFSVRPIDPPSSPPPTSPLPALPYEALLVDKKTASNGSRRSSRNQPTRPPRPQSSLPNIQPRTITSPPPTARKRKSALPRTVHTGLLQSVADSASQSQDIPKSIRLLTPTDATAFSEDVLSALPCIFHQCPREGHELRLHPKRNYISDTRVKTRRQRSKSPGDLPTQKPGPFEGDRIARSPLFVPEQSSEDGKRKFHFPPRQTSLSTSHRTVEPIRERFSAATQAHSSQWASIHNSRFHVANPTTFALNFAEEDSDKLTSLPQCFASHKVRSAKSIEEVRAEKSIFGEGRDNIPPEIMTFFALPYGKTLRRPDSDNKLVGLQSSSTIDFSAESTYRIKRDQTSEPGLKPALFHSADPELQAETRRLTPVERRKRKKKRMIWACITVTVVLLAAAGILGGVIVKLQSLSGPNVPIQQRS